MPCFCRPSCGDRERSSETPWRYCDLSGVHRSLCGHQCKFPLPRCLPAQLPYAMLLSCHIPRDRLTPQTLYLRYQGSHCLLPPLPRRTSSRGYVKSPAPLMVPPHGMLPGVVRVVHVTPLFIKAAIVSYLLCSVKAYPPSLTVPGCSQVSA